MAADPSSASDPDFFIFDARNITVATPPAQVSSLNTGPGLAGVDVAGSYAYGANDSKNGQLQIIDISTIATPSVKTTFNIAPGGADSNTVGTSIYYYDSKIYLGLKKNTHAELYVIDVSDPLSLSPGSIKGSYEVGATINAIYVRGNYAYIATPNSEELTIIDIDETSPTFMERVGGFNAPLGSGNGKSLKIVGNILYLGRTVGGKEFYILDITNPIAPTIVGSYDVNSSINDLVVAGRYAFLATSEANREFQVLDMYNPATPVFLGKYNFSEKATGIEYEDNLIYISNENQDALRIVTSGP